MLATELINHSDKKKTQIKTTPKKFVVDADKLTNYINTHTESAITSCYINAEELKQWIIQNRYPR